MQAAQATGDISSLINIVVNTSSLTTADFVKKTCGSLLFIYYTYVDYFHTRPVDIDDLVDGLLFIDAQTYIRKQAMSKQRGGR